MTLVLLIDNAEDFGSPPEVHGPFEEMDEALTYSREYREVNDIPGHFHDLPTLEDAEAWEEAGWSFSVVPIQHEVPTVSG